MTITITISREIIIVVASIIGWELIKLGYRKVLRPLAIYAINKLNDFTEKRKS